MEIFAIIFFSIAVVGLFLFLIFIQYWWDREKIIQKEILEKKIVDDKKVWDEFSKMHDSIPIFGTNCHCLTKKEFIDTQNICFGRNELSESPDRGYFFEPSSETTGGWISVQALVDATIPTLFQTENSVPQTFGWCLLNDYFCAKENKSKRYIYRKYQVSAIELTLKEYIKIISENNPYMAGANFPGYEDGYLLRTYNQPHEYAWNSKDKFRNEQTKILKG